MRSTALPAKLPPPVMQRVVVPRRRQILCRRRRPRYPCFIACNGSKRRRPSEVPSQRLCQGRFGQVVEIAERAVKQRLDEA